MNSWNDSRVALLKRLWANGLSANEISIRLGRTTRNAVIGKISRLNLPMRVVKQQGQDYAKKVRQGRRRPSPKQHKPHNAGPRLEGAPMPLPSEFDVARKSLVELEKGECRFPIGDGPFGFCALEVIPGKSYCLVHTQRAYSAFQPELKLVQATVEPVEPSGAVNRAMETA